MPTPLRIEADPERCTPNHNVEGVGFPDTDHIPRRGMEDPVSGGG